MNRYYYSISGASAWLTGWIFGDSFAEAAAMAVAERKRDIRCHGTISLQRVPDYGAPRLSLDNTYYSSPL